MLIAALNPWKPKTSIVDTVQELIHFVLQRI